VDQAPRARTVTAGAGAILGTSREPAATVLVVQIDARTELVIATDIARRLAISPQRVYVLASSAGFPKPLGTLGRSAVWRWSSVERWARETGRLPADDAVA
jgi:predicted DNA-binding transcriptional regulator AlpA